MRKEELITMIITMFAIMVITRFIVGRGQEMDVVELLSSLAGAVLGTLIIVLLSTKWRSKYTWEWPYTRHPQLSYFLLQRSRRVVLLLSRCRRLIGEHEA